MGGYVSNDTKDAVIGCARFLAEHNGVNTVALDLSAMSTWTDYFIVTSATSSTHLRALARHTDEYLSPLGFSPRKRPSLADDEEWCLIDYGDFVVHVMTGRAREFYELEKLWFEASLVPLE